MKRRIFSVFCALCLCLALLPVSAGAEDLQEWTYTYLGNWTNKGTLTATINDTVFTINFVDMSEENNLTISGASSMPPGPALADYEKFSGLLDLSGIIKDEDGIKYTITTIRNNAFMNCTGITALALPQGLTTIGNSAFNGCTGITDLDLPQGLKSIGNYAFNACTSLTDLTLPENVTTIGDRAFLDCTSLAEVILPDGLTTIEEGAFKNCTDLKTLTLPQGMTSIGKRPFTAARTSRPSPC